MVQQLSSWKPVPTLDSESEEILLSYPYGPLAFLSFELDRFRSLLTEIAEHPVLCVESGTSLAFLRQIARQVVGGGEAFFCKTSFMERCRSEGIGVLQSDQEFFDCVEERAHCGEFLQVLYEEDFGFALNFSLGVQSRFFVGNSLVELGRRLHLFSSVLPSREHVHKVLELGHDSAQADEVLNLIDDLRLNMDVIVGIITVVLVEGECILSSLMAFSIFLAVVSASVVNPVVGSVSFYVFSVSVFLYLRSSDFEGNLVEVFFKELTDVRSRIVEKLSCLD
jgi:hypothetical protein